MVLYSRQRSPDWTAGGDPKREAKCRKLTRPTPKADPFFQNEVFALAVCNGDDHFFGHENAGKPCPMRHECLIIALINHEGSGVWGGMQLHDRMHLKRNVPRSEWRWHPPTRKSEGQDEEVPDSLAA